MDIRRYIALIWHWWWLVFLGVLVAGATTYIVGINTTPVYSASARLLIDQAPGDNTYGDVLRNERLSTTYVELIQTTPVLENSVIRAAELYGDPVPTGSELSLLTRSLSSRTSVSAPIDTQIINLRVEDTDPQRAATLANTIANVFIERLQEQLGSRYETAVNRFDNERERVGLEIEAIEREVNTYLENDELSAEEEAALSLLETQLQEQQITYNRIFNDSQALRIESATRTNNVIIVEPAQSSSRPIRPQTNRNTLLAALMGGIFAIGVVLLIDYLDDTVKSPDQILEDTGLSAIGVISYIKSASENLAERLVTHTTPRAPTSEAYRVLRTNLEFSAVDEALRHVVVTSPSPSEGKSTTAANLGTVLAQAGNRVVIVDADLRRPSQHKIFEVANNQGLTTALLDSETPISYHVQPTKVPGLQIMTSGPLPPNPAELLNSQRMNNILEELKEEADVVIIDTPPTLTVADASILAPRTNGVVLVARIGSTRRDALIRAQESLVKTGAHIFGIVMNRANPGGGGYYYNYYYYRYYSYEYGERQSTRNGWSWLPKWLVGG